jgi:hypothetical protein
MKAGHVLKDFQFDARPEPIKEYNCRCDSAIGRVADYFIGFVIVIGYRLPLFVAGIGSALEIYPIPHIFQFQRPFAGLTDDQLLASDWYRVGRALQKALNSQDAETSRGEEQEPPDPK